MSQLRRTRGAVLGIAVILTLVGLLMLASAVYIAVTGPPYEAIAFLLVGLVACIFALKFYLTWLRLWQRDGSES